MLSKRGTVARIYLPPDANCLLSVADHCLRSRNYVNLIVQDKQPQLQYLTMDEAIEHCAKGASRWAWACNDEGFEPDVVLACAGDIPTMEIVAAAWWLRNKIPDLKVRVVNVVDLMTLFPPDVHPHGMTEHSNSWSYSPLTGRSSSLSTATSEPYTRLCMGVLNARALPRARLHRAGHDHHAF